MQYLEKLLDQFSDIPRNIILKADILRRGIKLNDDIRKAGATSNTTGISSKLESFIGSSSPPPSQFHFKADETTVDIKADERSPYEIREDGEGRYHIFCGEENFGEVQFIKRPSYMDKKTSDGKPCDYLIIQRGPSCICVSPLDFCAYFKKGESCKYCICSLGLDLGVQMKLIKPIPDNNILAEAIAIACEDGVDLKELKLSGGALYNVHKEANYIKRCLDAIFDRIDPPEEVTIFSQALEKDDQKELKDIGATNVCFDLEVWDEQLWPELLPGKAKTIGRQEWIKRLEDAVEVFGRGHVGTNFVGGFECAPRPGFLSQDEALKSYTEGFEYLIKRGIVPWFTIWTAYPLVGNFQVDDPPPTEFYLRLAQPIHELLEKYGVYPDLGFPRMGVDPPTLGLYCYYCYSMQFTRDYPRLIERE
ncbi:MAG: hypothetical protein JSU92_11940 [Deltaproteobacteria bacterium]|nr:MAG: hypothetical protein JSU92_11940 [Deltaproteobacteria bacterium]